MKINELEGKLSALEDTVNELNEDGNQLDLSQNEDIVLLQAADLAINASLSNCTADVSIIQSDINLINDDISDIKDDIKDINSSLVTSNNSIEDLQNDVKMIQAAEELDVKDIASLEGRVTTVESYSPSMKLIQSVEYGKNPPHVSGLLATLNLGNFRHYRFVLLCKYYNTPLSSTGILMKMYPVGGGTHIGITGSDGTPTAEVSTYGIVLNSSLTNDRSVLSDITAMSNDDGTIFTGKQTMCHPIDADSSHCSEMSIRGARSNHGNFFTTEFYMKRFDGTSDAGVTCHLRMDIFAI